MCSRASSVPTYADRTRARDSARATRSRARAASTAFSTSSRRLPRCPAISSCCSTRTTTSPPDAAGTASLWSVLFPAFTLTTGLAGKKMPAPTASASTERRSRRARWTAGLISAARASASSREKDRGWATAAAEHSVATRAAAWRGNSGREQGRATRMGCGVPRGIAGDLRDQGLTRLVGPRRPGQPMARRLPLTDRGPWDKAHRALARRGESTMKRPISWVAGLCLVALVGCSEDMGPVTAAWNQLVQTMTAKVDALKSQYASMQATVKALPAAADADGAGKAQKSKLDQALASHGQNLAALDALISTSKSSFDEAVKTGKVANAQKVLDDTKARFEQLSASMTASAAAVASLIGQYKKHLDEMSKVVDTDFTDLDFKPGTAQFLFDRPTSKATLVKLVAYMKSCPELVVDLVGHTSNEGSDATNVALSVARAKAVKNYLVKKEGIEQKKFREISGVGARENVVPEPAPGSPEAKKMGAKGLEDARRKNRRITVHPVTPCPG